MERLQQKVRKDEEAAAKDEQLKREQSRKHDTEIRLQQLKQSRGLTSQPPVQEEAKSSKHINLFEGIKILDPSKVSKSEMVLGNELRRGFKKMKKEALVAKVVLPEDEKYQLGYGVVGKGVKVPWYMDGKKRDSYGDGVGGDKEEEEEYGGDEGREVEERGERKGKGTGFAST